MKHVFLISSGDEDTFQAESYSGEELVILVVLDSKGLAGEADKKISFLRQKAEQLSLALAPKGIPNRVVLQWGDPREELDRCLERESAARLL
ncbi:MAG: hypothetical protein AB1626_03660 [Candidatus Micrarchaeota archaeon]